MSKEAAMSMAMGQEVTSVNPSLITGPTSIGEPGPVPIIEPKPETGLDSDRFAKIAQREAVLAKDREALKADKLRMAEKEKRYDEVLTRANTFEETRKADPIKAMKDIGFSETELYNFMADKEPAPPTPEQIAQQAAAEEVKKLRQELEDKQTADLKARDEHAIRGFQELIGKTVGAEPEKYEHCNYNGEFAQDLIYKTVLNIIEGETKAGNTVIPHDAMNEAIELVEKYYDDSAKELLKLKKLQPKTPEPVIEAAKPAPPQRKPPIPSLNNRVAPPSTSGIPQRETKDQKRQRLIDQLKG